MNEAFKTILEGLKDAGGCDASCEYDKGWDSAIGEAISIVEAVEKEYKGGSSMQEYIEKQELINYCRFDENIELARKENWGEVITLEDIDRMRKVTQEEIIEETLKAAEESMKQLMCDSCIERRVNQCEGRDKEECTWMKKIGESIERIKNEYMRDESGSSGLETESCTGATSQFSGIYIDRSRR